MTLGLPIRRSGKKLMNKKKFMFDSTTTIYQSIKYAKCKLTTKKIKGIPSELCQSGHEWSIR